jgi:two-component system chemotaxis response regulator CheY
LGTRACARRDPKKEGNPVKQSILIVEDSATMRSLIAATLEDLGDYDITEAASGFEALKILPGQPFDLIITDINMPDINGLELINFVKKHPTYNETPMIIVTTEKSAEDRKKGMALGANEYITKPFAAEDLQNAVRRLIEKKE